MAMFAKFIAFVLSFLEQLGDVFWVVLFLVGFDMRKRSFFEIFLSWTIKTLTLRIDVLRI